MSAKANNDADLDPVDLEPTQFDSVALDDADLDLDEAFEALVTELDEPTGEDGAGARPSFAGPSAFRTPTTAEDAALLSMLPARGMTIAGWDATSAQPPRASVAHARQTPSDGTTAAPASTSTHGAAIFCPTCKGPVDVRSPHVAVHGGAVRIYCSATCLDLRDALPVEAQTVALALPPKRRRMWWLAVLVVPAGLAAGYMLRNAGDSELVPPAPAPAVATTHPTTDLEPDSSGDPQAEADAKLVDELSRDAWIHPLAGPTRRMPRNHNGAFGAARAGDRPPECVSGHCGVDLGYVWGEPIYAVHEGVIDFINRGPNEEAGGVFVRIAHRGGTLFSWYFHLAAVPRSLRPGQKVSAGQMIGLLGDTGIKHSEPHLHFALSVKTSKHVHERYLDPEPLIAIWPLWVPNETRTGGKLSNEEPGLPMRASGGGRKRSKARKAVAPEPATAEAPAPASGAATAPDGPNI